MLGVTPFHNNHNSSDTNNDGHHYFFTIVNHDNNIHLLTSNQFNRLYNASIGNKFTGTTDVGFTEFQDFG